MNDSLSPVSIPPVSTAKLRVGAASHRGKVREENQDRISRFRVPLGDVFLVADGMGGHRDGARAAEIVIAGFEKHLGAAPEGTEAAAALQEAATRTNAELYELSAGTEHKMGATLVLVLLAGRRAVVAHAGDSRAYLVRGGELIPWTRDHTRVRKMLDHGMLSEEEARNHPDASVITRGFGQQPEIELEITDAGELRTGDRVVLCSDGLCGYVDDAVIARALDAADGAQDATDRLIELALEAGGEDNVSVQVVRIEDKAPVVEKRRRREVARPAPVEKPAARPAEARPAEARPAPSPPVSSPPAAASPSAAAPAATSPRLRLKVVVAAAALAAVLVAVLVWTFVERGETTEETPTEDLTLPSGETS